MKIAFVGKGGSGKTTLTSLFAAYLAESSGSVCEELLVIDADINQHLATALGATEEEAAAWPTLSRELPLIKEYLRGANPRITTADQMVKTTPAGAGSRLLTVGGGNPIWDACLRTVAGTGIRLAVTGPFSESDLGVSCYHSKVGAAELILNHLVDGPTDAVLMDMTAGADSFASGLFTRFDVTFLVCEPTVRSVGVFRQYVEYAEEYGVQIAVIGNKVEGEEDLAFLRDQVGPYLHAVLGRSAHVRAAERGEVRPIGALESANREALDTMAALVDRIGRAGKDWERFQWQAAEFHRRNALAWGNERSGTDLTAQIDPDFTHGPSALDVAGATPIP